MSSFDAVRGSSRYYSTSTIGTKSNSSSTNSVGRHSLSSGISPRSSKSSSLNVSPATSRNSLDSLRSGQQSLVHDDNDNVVANSSLNSSSSSRNSDNSHSKYRRALGTRQGEVDAIRSKYPSKIPVIVERFDQEVSLPHLQKSKFLVPQELSMSQLVTVVRNRLRLSSTQAIFLLVNNRSIASLSKTILEVYREYSDADGFLYLSYASQEAFGSHSVT